MPRGGARQGTPGKAYPQRRDLNPAPTQPVKTATGQAYGQAQAQARAQQAIPLPAQPQPQPGPADATGAPGITGTGAGVIPIGAPTQRPDEPITAGLPIGAGPGPEVIGMDTEDDIGLELRAIYRLYPDDNIRRLIELYDAGF